MYRITMNGSANDYVDIFEYYTNKFDELYVQPIIFGEFTVILLAVFLIRLIMLFRIESEKGFNLKDRKKHPILIYLSGHVAFELLIAYIICYACVKFTNANPESYIINMIIGPAIGFTASVVIDIKLIMPLESSMHWGMPDVELSTKKNNKDKDSNSNNTNNITVNVNNTPTDIKTDDNAHFKDKKPYRINFLNKDLINSEDFNAHVVDSINEIIETQYYQSLSIDANSERLESIISSVDILRNTEMIDKKLEIKSEIYKCLNKGFVTPEENDKITLKYQSYRSLGGNHEIESLYNDHYLKLSIHEERRQKDIPVEVDNRRNNNYYYYGEFDMEYDDDDKNNK